MIRGFGPASRTRWLQGVVEGKGDRVCNLLVTTFVFPNFLVYSQPLNPMKLIAYSDRQLKPCSL